MGAFCFGGLIKYKPMVHLQTQVISGINFGGFIKIGENTKLNSIPNFLLYYNFNSKFNV